jgi:hypothetical protein
MDRVSTLAMVDAAVHDVVGFTGSIVFPAHRVDGAADDPRARGDGAACVPSVPAGSSEPKLTREIWPTDVNRLSGVRDHG